MPLEGLHHVTAITGDAPRNVEFYASTLGLRLVKKTVNFDAPDVYHLYYGDETGTPGSILTFFEFPGARPGRPGAGMVHRLLWRVGLAGRARLLAHAAGDRRDGVRRPGGPRARARGGRRRARPPLTAAASGIPDEHALQGFHGVRAHSDRLPRSAPLLERIGFTRTGDGDDAWTLAGAQRRATLHYDAPPARPGVQSAGTVHHVAWSAADDGELELLREAAAQAGARPTPIIDRQYFHSVYFREPSGVLFELATRDIGFDVDEPRATLGQALKLPPQYESRRAELERSLTPLANPRDAGR